MSLYMSDSLVGNINLNEVKKSLIYFKIKGADFLIKELTIFENKIEIEAFTNDVIAYKLLTKECTVADISLSWPANKEIIEYSVISLKHFLENDMDNYILKLQLIFEV